MAAGDGTFYSFSNVGYAVPEVPESRSAFGYTFENVGVTLTATRLAAVATFENVGFPLPPEVAVLQPQAGWGCAMKPAVTTKLRVPESAAKVQSYVEVVAPA